MALTVISDSMYPAKSAKTTKKLAPAVAAARARTGESPKKYSSATPADAPTSATLAWLGV
jgi:hypothetical protein